MPPDTISQNPLLSPPLPPVMSPQLKKISRRSRWMLIWGTIIVLSGVAAIAVSARPPRNFMPDTLVHISANASLSSIAATLKSEHVIQSAYLFRATVTLIAKSRSAGAGDYFFQTPPSVWQVAYRLVHNEQGLTPVRATFPEGTSVRGMSVILAAALNASEATTGPMDFIFSSSTFRTLASTSEGYLFPDTYFFPPNAASVSIIGTMKANFNQKIKPIMPAILASGHSLASVVTMASILEKEALTDSDRRVIAGILWKRIAAGQPLQVDSPFAYVLGKTSDKLTLADLQTNSPYNTYVNKGLPPTPINNPGLEALTAAINASSTPYWYYLSDKKGVIHYAATYDQHLANRALYLGK